MNWLYITEKAINNRIITFSEETVTIRSFLNRKEDTRKTRTISFIGAIPQLIVVKQDRTHLLVKLDHYASVQDLTYPTSINT